MISTRNRLAELKRTCLLLSHLNPEPDELMVTADGCTDGTIEFVRKNYPRAKLLINEKPVGSVRSRDRMLRETHCDLVFSLDDDSYPEQSDAIERIRAIFVRRPKMAVAHFPQKTDEYPASLTQTDFGQTRFTGSFANSGAVYRRTVYVQLPGFYLPFFHICMKNPIMLCNASIGVLK
jgi:GT2 family glycosyltransferase